LTYTDDTCSEVHVTESERLTDAQAERGCH
jgi:hypothetical protein